MLQVSKCGRVTAVSKERREGEEMETRGKIQL